MVSLALKGSGLTVKPVADLEVRGTTYLVGVAQGVRVAQRVRMCRSEGGILRVPLSVARQGL